MKTCRGAVSGTPAVTSCRATPSPLSITYAVPLATITWAGAELTFLGRGPPPVPRRMSLVPAPPASRRLEPPTVLSRLDTHPAVARAATVARNDRLSVVAHIPHLR